MNEWSFFERLCMAFGPSGCEEEVCNLLVEEVRSLTDNYTVDRSGNLLVTVPGSGEGYDPSTSPVLLCSAHMDEVGFMINAIEPSGLLSFSTVGGMDPRILAGRRVTVLGHGKDKLCGVITAKPFHLQSREERKQVTPASKLYIDIGAADRDEAMRLVELGDFATFASEFYRFGEGLTRVKGKAIDDRLGCAALLYALRRLLADPRPHPYTVCFAFSVREEIGISGAQTAAYRLNPTHAIVVESTAVADIADVPAASRVAHLGQGGALSLADRSTVYDRGMINFALHVARTDDIPVQIKQYVSGGNDAGHIHKVRAGVRCLALSAPTRYLHSASCVADVRDYEAILALLAAMVCRFDEQTNFEGRDPS